MLVVPSGGQDKPASIEVQGRGQVIPRLCAEVQALCAGQGWEGPLSTYAGALKAPQDEARAAGEKGREASCKQ